MKLNYKLWNVICTPTELKKSYDKHLFRSVIYFTTDYVVATEGHMLVAIPACKAFTVFDKKMYSEMIGHGVLYDTAKEIFKNDFKIENGSIILSTGVICLFSDSSIFYPDWKRAILNDSKKAIEKIAISADYLKRICDAINCTVPVLYFGANNITIKPNGELDSNIIAVLCPATISK